MSKTVCVMQYTAGAAPSGGTNICSTPGAGTNTGAITFVQDVCVQYDTAKAYKMTACTADKVTVSAYGDAKCATTASSTDNNITIASFSSCTAITSGTIWAAQRFISS